MCRRILPVAVAIAVAVACGRNRATAGGDETAGVHTKENTTGSVLTETAETTQTKVSQDGRRILFESPYYTTDLTWDAGQVSFCDMHLCAAPGSEKNLAIMDGSGWSGPQRKAGIYFMESIPGIGLNVIQCKDPENIVRGNGTVSLEWDDMYGYRSFRMKMDETSATIEGYDPSTGQPANNWFLSLITAREKGGRLPFTVIVPERVNSEMNGREYHMGIGPGKAALNRDDTPPVFNIYPENGTITLKFRD